MRKNLSFLNAGSFVGYVDARNIWNTTDRQLQRFFPVQQIPGLDYSYVKTTKGVVELSIASEYDAEPIAQNRESFNAMEGDLPLFRRKMSVSEKEEANLMSAMAMNNYSYIQNVVTSIYDDKFTLITGAQWTQEYMRAKAIMDGKITMAGSGGAINIDYQVPAGNKYTLTGTDAWTDPKAPILTQIKNWIEKVWEETGVKPDVMLLNWNTFKMFVSNEQVRNNLLPISILATATVASSLALSDEQIAQSIKAYCGLKEIIVYNHKVSIEGTTYDLIEDNKVSLFPSGELGNTLVGTSPAELSIYRMGNDYVELTADGIAVAVIEPNGTGAPYTTETQVEFVSLPSFMMSDFVIQATVA